MTKEEAAAVLNGDEYRDEGSRDHFARMKEAGLVALFGASDDLAELRGAINDETYPGYATDDGSIYITRDGLFQSKCDCDDCPYAEEARKRASVIHAHWGRDGYSWSYSTDIPHATFVINEDGEPYCRGIVFALADVPA